VPIGPMILPENIYSHDSKIGSKFTNKKNQVLNFEDVIVKQNFSV
jgi:hypothetical protein